MRSLYSFVLHYKKHYIIKINKLGTSLRKKDVLLNIKIFGHSKAS